MSLDLAAPEMRLYWDIAQFAMTGAVGLYVYFAQREQVRREALSKLEDDIDGHLASIQRRLGAIEAHVQYAPSPATYAATHSRIAVLEESVRRGPSDDDIKRLHARVDDAAQGLAALRGELSGVTRLLTAIDGYLRDRDHDRAARS
jgi:hypothetical protein